MSKTVKAEVLTNHTFVKTQNGLTRADKGSVIEIDEVDFNNAPASHFRRVDAAPKATPKAEKTRTPKEEPAPVMPSASAAPVKG